LIGPIQNSFKPVIEKFYADHPDKGDKIIFTGPIYDKKELWEWYNRSKVFLLSSKWEGFALVFVESQRFSNFIISTPVGAAEDVIEGEKYGRIVPLDDVEVMSHKIQEIIDGETNIDVFQNFDKQSLSWEHRIKVVAEKLRKS
jgi:glycosyltransferase involved in cell wall biosynthesis